MTVLPFSQSSALLNCHCIHKKHRKRHFLLKSEIRLIFHYSEMWPQEQKKSTNISCVRFKADGMASSEQWSLVWLIHLYYRGDGLQLSSAKPKGTHEVIT